MAGGIGDGGGVCFDVVLVVDVRHPQPTHYHLLHTTTHNYTLQLDITRGQLHHNSPSPPVIVYSLALNPRECKHLCLLVLDHNPRRCQPGALQLDITRRKIGKAIARGRLWCPRAIVELAM